MNKNFYVLFFLLIISSDAWSTSFVCNEDPAAVFNQNSCQSESIQENEVRIENRKLELEQFDSSVVLAEPIEEGIVEIPKVGNSAANKTVNRLTYINTTKITPRSNEKLANQKINNGNLNSRIIVQQSKPRLTRKHLLQREIAFEQAALIKAQAKLAAIRKNNGDILSQEKLVNDIRANIQAIRQELKRLSL